MEKNFEPLRLFLKKGLELTELHKQNIKVIEKNGFYLYNYNQNVLVPRDDRIIRLCRGIVLKKDGTIVNHPFDRFFNYHEPECDKVDWSTAEIQEKTDGTLISCWWNGNGWQVTTRGCFPPSNEGVDFSEIFNSIFKNTHRLSPKRNYFFELISSKNRIVTKYTEEFVVLIGGREVASDKEVSQGQLDLEADNMDVRRPKKFKATNIEECRKLFENLNDDEEGLVVVDINFNRFKLKQESYLKMAKIISLKDQDLLDYILGKTELDADFDNLPEVKERIDKIGETYRDTMEYISKVFDNLKKYTNKKEFAEHALKYKFSSVLFCLLGEKKINVNYKKLVEFQEEIIDTNKKTLIVLRGIPGSSKSSWVEENNLQRYTISPDLLRLMYCAPNPLISQKYNKQVWDLAFEILEIRMKEESFTVMDGTHVTDKSINKYQILCDKYGYELQIKDFKISLDEALRRNKLREEYKKVPEDVIKRMYDLYTKLYKP